MRKRKMQGKNLAIDISAVADAKDYYRFSLFVNVVEDSIVAYTDTVVSNIAGDEFSSAGRIRMRSQLKNTFINAFKSCLIKLFEVTDSPRRGEDFIRSVRQCQVSCGLADRELLYRPDRPYGPGGFLSSGGERPTRTESLPITSSLEEALSALIRCVPASSVSFGLQQPLSLSLFKQTILPQKIVYITPFKKSRKKRPMS